KIKNDSSVTEYYKAFAQQNDVRLIYIAENIIICDTLLIPNSALLAKAVRNNDTLMKEFSIDSSESTAKEFLTNKPNGLSWDKDKRHKYSKFITDLKPTSIQFYRIIFNKTKTKGILLYHFTIWGYLDGDACFSLENQKSNWSIKDYHWISVHMNEKRWKIE
ncbi:MAG: hypothetical protein WCK09_15445, partial [Bacteroidota bacterium]